ncbi:MAG: hypothetical protein HQK58_15125 [Deltaproteobacteria bacterium]|nr:hypothetical protein [Deltaproteobacteria bacterium]
MSTDHQTTHLTRQVFFLVLLLTLFAITGIGQAATQAAPREATTPTPIADSTCDLSAIVKSSPCQDPVRNEKLAIYNNFVAPKLQMDLDCAKARMFGAITQNDLRNSALQLVESAILLQDVYGAKMG